MGCIAASTDCEASCDRAHEEELAARSRAQRAGCENQFNNSLTCADGLEPCENGCGAEASALTSCLTAFCMANPSSDVCL